MQKPGIATGVPSGRAGGGGFGGQKEFTGGKASAKGASMAAAGGRQVAEAGANASREAVRGEENN